jgi:hypothetical protein
MKLLHILIQTSTGGLSQTHQVNEEQRSYSIDLELKVLGYCHLWQYPTTNQVVAPLVPLMVAWFKALLTPPC